MYLLLPRSNQSQKTKCRQIDTKANMAMPSGTLHELKEYKKHHYRCRRKDAAIELNCMITLTSCRLHSADSNAMCSPFWIVY
jgi:hypothetical protein